jgi:hypothetical protein
MSQRSLIILLVACFIYMLSAQAHHILGIPHYAYDESYPQAPILTYKVKAGVHEVQMTGYPGNPQPNEACSLHVYVRSLDGGAPFDGAVSLKVHRDRFILADPLIYGPSEAKLEEAIYKFYPRFDQEANYNVFIDFEYNGEPWTIELPMVVGEPGNPWVVLGSVGGGLALFIIIIRAIRIKQKRRAQEERDTPVDTVPEEVRS